MHSLYISTGWAIYVIISYSLPQSPRGNLTDPAWTHQIAHENVKLTSYTGKQIKIWTLFLCFRHKNILHYLYKPKITYP